MNQDKAKEVKQPQIKTFNLTKNKLLSYRRLTHTDGNNLTRVLCECFCGPELYRVRTCVNPMQRCFLALAAQFAFASEEAIVQHIANTDLRATCGYVDVLK